MKKIVAVWICWLSMIGWVGADLIYSNDFSVAEFSADGVDAVSGSFTNVGGRLVPTVSSATAVGFRVDLSALGLAADSDVSAVKITVSGKAPLDTDGSGYVGLAFQDHANYNVNTYGNPVLAINGLGNLRAAGGAGFAQNALDAIGQGDNFTSGGEFTMTLVYNKNGTIDSWYNGVYSHIAQEIVTSDAIELQYAVVQFRNLTPETGANLDMVTIETIPEPATIGLLSSSLAAVMALRRLR